MIEYGRLLKNRPFTVLPAIGRLRRLRAFFSRYAPSSDMSTPTIITTRIPCPMPKRQAGAIRSWNAYSGSLRSFRQRPRKSAKGRHHLADLFGQ